MLIWKRKFIILIRKEIFMYILKKLNSGFIHVCIIKILAYDNSYDFILSADFDVFLF